MGHTCAVLLYRVIEVTPPWLIAAGARATPLTTAREKDSILSAWKNKKNKTEPESFHFQTLIKESSCTGTERCCLTCCDTEETKTKSWCDDAYIHILHSEWT